jgi:hypothetical protein
LKAHDWQHAGVDTETTSVSEKGKAQRQHITLSWQCTACGAQATTKTSAKTICTPRPAAHDCTAQGVEPDCDQETVRQVHDL